MPNNNIITINYLLYRTALLLLLTFFLPLMTVRTGIWWTAISRMITLQWK